MISCLRRGFGTGLFVALLIQAAPAAAGPGTYAYVAAGAQTSTATFQETTKPDGAALRIRGSGLAVDGSTASFEAEASASLRQGTLKAFGASNRPYPAAGTAITALWDRVTFSAPAPRHPTSPASTWCST